MRDGFVLLSIENLAEYLDVIFRKLGVIKRKYSAPSVFTDSLYSGCRTTTAKNIQQQRGC